MLWGQNQNFQSRLSTALDINMQLQNSISMDERIKANLEFEVQEVKDKIAAFDDWHSQEIQDKDVEIAILEEELKILREQGTQPEINVATSSATNTDHVDDPALGKPESDRQEHDVETASLRHEVDGLAIINSEADISALLHENTLLLQKLDQIRSVLKTSFPNLEDGFGNLPFLVASFTGDGDDRRRKYAKKPEQPI